MSLEQAMMEALAKLFAAGKAEYGRYPKGDKIALKIQSAVYVEDLQDAARRKELEYAPIWGKAISVTPGMIDETAKSFRQEVGSAFPDSADFAARALNLWRDKFDLITIETERDGRPAVAMRLVPKGFSDEQREAAIQELRALYPAPAPALPRATGILSARSDEEQQALIFAQLAEAKRMRESA